MKSGIMPLFTPKETVMNFIAKALRVILIVLTLFLKGSAS